MIGKIFIVCIENMFDVLRNDRVIINVGGFWYNIFLMMLKNIFDIWLLWIVENYLNSFDFDFVFGEYFFDWYLWIFIEVLNYYCIGKFYCLVDVCLVLF